MARTSTQIDNRNTTSSERQLGPFTMTKALRELMISLDRSGFTNPAAFFFFRAEYRLAPDAPWQPWGTFSTHGGATVDPTTFAVDTIPPVGSQVQVFVRTNGVTLRQALSLVEVD